MIALPVKNKDEVIAFFTTDILRVAQKPVSQAGYKEGYLTKRGKNFGGWKTRYFVLQGPSLEYYESVSYLIAGSYPHCCRVWPVCALVIQMLMYFCDVAWWNAPGLDHHYRSPNWSTATRFR